MIALANGNLFGFSSCEVSSRDLEFCWGTLSFNKSGQRNEGGSHESHINRNVLLKTALPTFSLKYGKKGRLRYLDRAHNLHSFLSLFLFFK